MFFAPYYYKQTLILLTIIIIIYWNYLKMIVLFLYNIFGSSTFITFD